MYAGENNMLYNHKSGISFKKVNESHLYDLLCLKEESWFGTHRITFSNIENQKTWFQSLCKEDVHAPKNLVLMAYDEENNIVGVVKILNIDWQNRRAELGWDIFKEFRGRGNGKKIVAAGVACCFEMLNLRRLQADILVTNTASQKCAEAAGFIQEGYQKEVVFRNGKYVDNLIYGILNVSCP